MIKNAGKIKLLSSEVINQIAAGEVVERPAHLVKELIENSLDAKASKIEIYFSEGGKNIRVLDNGFGIHPEDLALVFQRHSTSKITSAGDLFSLISYGFRGEALSSISSVSKVKIVSKKKSSNVAYRVISDFGTISSTTETSGNYGTEISISDLFSNVPARLKFLKSDSAEGSQIKAMVKALALVNPEVEFRLSDEKKLHFHFHSKKEEPNPFLARSNEVLGVNHLFGCRVQDNGGFSVNIAYSAPNKTQKSSKNIWLFAQNRWVTDKTLLASLLGAYRSLLMHGEYPIAVLNINCPPDQIDINVHPTKSQVKFVDNSFIFRFVNHALKNELELAKWIPKNSGTITSAYYNFQGESEKVKSYYPSSMDKPKTSKSVITIESLKFNEPVFDNTQFKNKETLNSFQSVDLAGFTLGKSDSLDFSKNKNSNNNNEESLNFYWSKMQYVGQVNLTYLICQKDNSMVLVDQHAAHERVLYEKIKNNWNNGGIDIQNYLLPLTLDLEIEQVEALMTKKVDLEKFGVSIEQSGPSSIVIQSKPELISDNGIVTALKKLAEQMISSGDGFAFEDKLDHLCATMACHSAVRAGQTMNKEQAQSLLESMDEYPLSSFCPHGRPVYVEHTFNKIEKEFGRLV